MPVAREIGASRGRHWALRATVFGVVLAAAPLSVLAGSGVQRLARGRNFSDLGVAMYENSAPAALLGLALSFCLCAALLWALYRFLPGCRSLVVWFGMPWSFLCNALWLFALALGF